MKRKRDYIPLFSCGDSWEEHAFAEDAAGRLGGCVWPPRCYSCSFCSREFKSAQALGGHMNVHRRDRARLKLSPNPEPHHPLPQKPNGFLCPQQDQSCTMLYNRNSDHLDKRMFFNSSSLLPRVSSGPVCNTRTLHENHPTKVLNLSCFLGNGSVLEDKSSSCKRRRIDVTSFDVLQKSSSEVVKFEPNKLTEDLDLELRLGDPPKVK